MRHYLVVANQTLGSPQLVDHLVSCHQDGQCDFYLLVPATHAHDHDRWTPGEAMALARRRLHAALDHLRGLGLTAHGTVGDPSPVVAIGAMLRQRPFDELIVATLAPGPSRWLANHLPERIRKIHRMPVTHIVAGPVEVLL